MSVVYEDRVDSSSTTESLVMVVLTSTRRGGTDDANRRPAEWTQLCPDIQAQLHVASVSYDSGTGVGASRDSMRNTRLEFA